jgi:hypothetical protein
VVIGSEQRDCKIREAKKVKALFAASEELISCGFFA